MHTYIFFILFPSIDARNDTGRLGRLINHSKYSGNITTKKCFFEKPRLYFVAKRYIPAGTELLYDYGDRDPETLRELPWLRE